MTMKRRSFINLSLALTVLALMLVLGCTGEPGLSDKESEVTETPAPFTLTYLGQAAFLVEYGVRVMMDPYSPNMGYGEIDIPADLVTVSHNHFDHNYVEGAPGAVVLYGLDQTGQWNDIVHHFAGLNLYTVNTYHDNRQGGILGKNSIFVLETAELRLAHLGDLGHGLGEAERELLGKVDILLIPVGGHYTLTAEEALQTIDLIAPAVVIPMHYRTGHFPELNLNTLEDFLSLELPYPVRHRGATVEISGAELPGATEIWVMEYSLPE